MWIKICGLTTVKNALQVVETGVDAIGLNFYKKSKRFVSPEVAKEIVKSVPDDVNVVGLFVNHSVKEVRDLVEFTGIKTIQFHGDESPVFVAEFSDFQVIKAFRVSDQNIHQLSDEISLFRDAETKLFGCLIDADIRGHFGGTGQTAPWKLLREHYQFDTSPPLILAGGLNVENVREAIQEVQPWGVDTASGVESSPGIKDVDLSRQFLELVNK